MGEAMLYNRPTSPNQDYDWNVAFNNQDFIDIIFPILIDYVDYSSYLEIPNQEFKNIYNYKTVTFYSCYKDIGIEGFAGMLNLTSASFLCSKYDKYWSENGRLVTRLYDIKESAFENCNGLVTFSASVLYNIQRNAFKNCKNLTNIYMYISNNKIEDLLRNNINIKIYNDAFINCNRLEYLTISCVGEIESYAFAEKHFKSAWNVMVGNSFCSIVGSHAFENCSEMSGVFYLNQLATYSNLYNYMIWQYIQPTISDYAFNGCEQLNEFRFGIVCKIGNYAFYNCKNLYKIYLGSKNFMYDVGDRYISGSLIIDSYAFANCYSLTSIFGGSIINYIGSHAFENCSNLELNLNLGENIVNKISDYAFANCASLRAISMNQRACIKQNWSGADKPLQLEVASTAFYNCEGLHTINLQFAKDIPENMFSNHEYFSQFYWGISGGIWQQYISNYISELGLSYLTNIGSYAFANCNNMNTTEIYCVNTIYENAFLNASVTGGIGFLVGNEVCLQVNTNAFKNAHIDSLQLNRTYIPSYELYISSYAFDGVYCQYIDFYNVHSISDYAFNDAQLNYISIHGCLCQSRNLNISSEIFYNTIINEKLCLYDIDNILYKAFYHKDFSTADIKVKSIQSNAFENCSRLNTVNFVNDDLTYIGSNAFLNCSLLSLINLSTAYWENMPVLEDINAFSNIHSNYVIKVAEKYYNSFIEAPNWSLISDHIISTNITYDDNIPPYCFYDMIMSVSSITFSENVCGYIGSHAFENCTNVESIRFLCENYYSDNKPAYIGEYAFKNCSDLINLTILTGKHISEYAFAELQNLSYVFISTNEWLLCDIKSHAFEDCNINRLEMRDIDTIYEYAFFSCSKLKYASIGYNVCKYIKSHAFEGCISLSSLALNINGASRSSIYTNDIIIDNYAFKDCYSLINISFNGLNKIKTNAFYNCSSFEYLDIDIKSYYISPYDIQYQLLTIEPNAFYGCSNFNNLSASYIDTIYSNAFNGTNITDTSYIGYNICEYIDDDAFNGTSISCISCLNNLGYTFASLNNDMKRFKCKFGSNAFNGLSTLQQITIYKPEVIKSSQFADMSALQSVSINICNETIYYSNIYTVYKDLIFNIDEYAFENCTNLSYANIRCVDTIKAHAFEGCINLGVSPYNNSIGYDICFNVEDYAFSGCTNLSVLNLNGSYFSLFQNPEIDEYYLCRLKLSSNAFRNLPNLYSVNLNGCADITSHLFENCSKLEYVFANCVNYSHSAGFAYSAMIDIGEYAFAGCSKINQLYCSYIKTIKSHAFEDFYMSNGAFICGMSLCNEIREYAFNNATIQYVYLNEFWSIFQSGSLVQCSIEANAFTNCSFNTLWIFNIKNINENAFNNTYVSNLNISAISDYSLSVNKNLFSGVKGITNLNLEFVNIESNTFSHNSTLNNVYISMVSEIGEDAFYECSQLSFADIQLVNKIRSRAFKNCYSLDYITGIYGNNSNDRRIEEEAFMNCINLSCSAYAPMHNYIGSRAYYNTKISNVYMPNATYVGESAFADNSDLNSLLLYSVETIESYAFYNCYNLSTLMAGYWPYCINIGEYAFYNCAFSSIRIASPSLSSIGDYAFNSCANLSMVFLNESISHIGYKAFADCSNVSQIFLSADIYNISNKAFADCTNLSMIIVGSSINIIPKIQSIDVFDNISSNFSIYIYSDLYSSFINDSVWNLLSSHFSMY